MSYRSSGYLLVFFLPELQPYKYAGYPMLIKTIRLETGDDALFSKSAPLLTAASELAYHTINCSALNAEELRREDGIEVKKMFLAILLSVCQKDSLRDTISNERSLFHEEKISNRIPDERPDQMRNSSGSDVNVWLVVVRKQNNLAFEKVYQRWFMWHETIRNTATPFGLDASPSPPQPTPAPAPTPTPQNYFKSVTSIL